MKSVPTAMQARLRNIARTRWIILGTCLSVLSSVQCHGPSHRQGEHLKRGPAGRFPLAGEHGPDDPEAFAARDPLGFLKACRQHYMNNVSDYRCLFAKRERIGGVVKDEQRIQVLYREHPLSVDMRWISNIGRASRVTYVAGRWVSDDGREMARVVPSGILGLIVPGGVKRDIHGLDMLKESRRPIDFFGFRSTLDLITKYCDQAADDPNYRLRYDGIHMLDGRPGYVFERRLPYTGRNGEYPDRLLVVHIDREWLVPTGCTAFADDAGDELLGSYTFTSVEFNTGLTDADF